MFTTQAEKRHLLRYNSNEFFKSPYKKVDYALFSAMPEELEFFRSHFANRKSENVKVGDFSFIIYEYNYKRILLATTGLGTTFASSVITLIYNSFSPSYIVFSGTAGAINPKLKLRDVVIVEKAFEAEIQGAFNALNGTPFESCLTHPLNNVKFPQMYSADEELLQIVSDIDCPEITMYKGTVVTSNAFPAPQELFNKIKSENPYIIDMETSALYQIGWLYKARVLAVRGVSNVLNHDGSDDNVHESDVKGSSEAAARVALKLIDALSIKYSFKESKEENVSRESQQEVAILIQNHELQPHPEGGYYKQTFKSTNLVKALDEKLYANEIRNSGTAIFYVLEGLDFSALHKLKSDEIWHFYRGSTVKIHVIDEQGQYSEVLLGDPFINAKASYQVVIPAGNWFAAELCDKTSFCFVGCTVTPGFDFKDFELADRVLLNKEFPQHSLIIERLTRVKNPEPGLSCGLKMH